MLNYSSLVLVARRLCGEEWFFQQDDDAIHNASITKKYLLEQKKTSWLPNMLSIPQSYRKFVGIVVEKVYEEGQQHSAISELKNAILDAWEK